MRTPHSLALFGVSLVLSTLVAAQDKPAAKPAAKAPARTAASAAQPAILPAPALSPANPEQQLAASLVLLGPYDCEFKQTLSVTKHQVDGYVVVTFSSRAYTMKPVRSTTGAVRLEEVAGGPMLMVQIPTKSMLMDTVRGRRIVDACVHEEQAKEVNAPNSLGMNLQGQVNTADTAPAPKR
jgi:hypothetical protein